MTTEAVIIGNPNSGSAGDEGYLIFEPDWKPVIWPESELAIGLSYYGAELPLTGAAVGTPPRPMPDIAEMMERLKGGAAKPDHAPAKAPPAA